MNAQPKEKQPLNTLLILTHDASIYETLILPENLPDLEIIACDTVEKARPHAGKADILFGAPDLIEQILTDMTRLEWVQSTWAGVTPLLKDECRKDYILTNVKDIFGPMMKEYVIGYMLAHERKLLSRYATQQKKEWDGTEPGRIRGKTAGIMGVGSIGTDIAAALKFFGMTTYGWARNATPRSHFDTMFGSDQLTEFVMTLDYLITVLPDTPETTRLLDASLFKLMKKEAVLINVGRGNVVDESALVDALKHGEIAGAVLDVFQEEPLPKSHPFWETPGLIVTSHTAALSFPEDIAPLFVENYRRYVAGDPLNYQVDFNQGY